MYKLSTLIPLTIECAIGLIVGGALQMLLLLLLLLYYSQREASHHAVTHYYCMTHCEASIISSLCCINILFTLRWQLSWRNVWRHRGRSDVDDGGRRVGRVDPV